MFDKRIGRGLSCWSDIPHQQSLKYKPTTIKTSWLARTATSSKDRWIGVYPIGLAIPGNLSSPNNNNNKKIVTVHRFLIAAYLVILSD